MTKPTDDEVRHRIRAALSGFTLGVEQWAGMLLSGEDKMTDDEKIDYLIEGLAISLAYCNLMVQAYADIVGATPGEVLAKLYETVDDLAGRGKL